MSMGGPAAFNSSSAAQGFDQRLAQSNWVGNMQWFSDDANRDDDDEEEILTIMALALRLLTENMACKERVVYNKAEQSVLVAPCDFHTHSRHGNANTFPPTFIRLLSSFSHGPSV
jgi:hypothetical protein